MNKYIQIFFILSFVLFLAGCDFQESDTFQKELEQFAVAIAPLLAAIIGGIFALAAALVGLFFSFIKGLFYGFRIRRLLRAELYLNQELLNSPLNVALVDNVWVSLADSNYVNLSSKQYHALAKYYTYHKQQTGIDALSSQTKDELNHALKQALSAMHEEVNLKNLQD